MVFSRRRPDPAPVSLALALMLGLAASPAVLAQDGIGRLFTSPSERRALNQLRLEAQFARPAEIEPEPEAPREAAQARSDDGPGISRLEINGVVRRSRGPSTVWVNGVQVERGGVSREGLRVQPGSRPRDGVRVSLPSGASTVYLKPGQAIDVVTGTLVDAFEARPGEDAASGFATLPGGTDSSAAPGIPLGASDAVVEPTVPVSTAPRLTPQMRERLSDMSPEERAAAIGALRAVGVLEAPAAGAAQ